MQWNTASAPARAALTASGWLTSTRRRSTSSCSGPEPERVMILTRWPDAASCVATVQPTGPAPVTTLMLSMVIFIPSSG
jgi:hypothetical protein